MLKLLVCACMCITVALAVFKEEPTLETCQCWPGYKPQKVDGPKVMCAGIRVFALKPCNLGPQPPRCKCGEGVSGILTDKSGTWCSQYDEGVELRRWECENKEEWAQYRLRLAQFEKDNDDF